MALGTRQDPYGEYNFKVEIDGLIVAGFKECSGIEISQDAGDYREGTDKTLVMRRLPGLITSQNITLKRGVIDSDVLWSWQQTVASGNVERKNVTVSLYDDAQREVAVEWVFQNCWPTKWTGPSLDAQTNEVAIEALEIAHEGLSAKWTRKG